MVAHVIKKSLIWIAASLVALLTLGCLAQFQDAIRKQGGTVRASEETVTLDAGTVSKPAARVETREPASNPKSNGEPDTKNSLQGRDSSSQAGAGPAKAQARAEAKVQAGVDATKGLVKPQRAQDDGPPKEDEIVRNAAVKLARSLGTVTNIKICHLSPKDEWWAFIYVDIGNLIDVKQFIWDRQHEKFEPFTVLTQFPKSKLSVHLTNNKPGSRCEVLTLPASGQGAETKSDSTSSEFSHR